jgi:hypothetical protein
MPFTLQYVYVSVTGPVPFVETVIIEEKPGDPLSSPNSVSVRPLTAGATEIRLCLPLGETAGTRLGLAVDGSAPRRAGTGSGTKCVEDAVDVGVAADAGDAGDVGELGESPFPAPMVGRGATRRKPMRLCDEVRALFGFAPCATRSPTPRTSPSSRPDVAGVESPARASRESRLIGAGSELIACSSMVPTKARQKHPHAAAASQPQRNGASVRRRMAANARDPRETRAWDPLRARRCGPLRARRCGPLPARRCGPLPARRCDRLRARRRDPLPARRRDLVPDREWDPPPECACVSIETDRRNFAAASARRAQVGASAARTVRPGYSINGYCVPSGSTRVAAIGVEPEPAIEATAARYAASRTSWPGLTSTGRPLTSAVPSA